MATYDQVLRQLQAQQNDFDRRLNQQAGYMRKSLEENLGHLSNIASALHVSRSGMSGLQDGGRPAEGTPRSEWMGPVVAKGAPGAWFVPGYPGIMRVEDIPGKRIPFQFIVEIPINGSVTTPQMGTITIDMAGPFVAERRIAAFRSDYNFSINDDRGVVATFNGRSWGRYRPIHSVCDINDSQHNSTTDAGLWVLGAAGAFDATNTPAAGTALPDAALSLPSNSSSFRTMEGDYEINVISTASALPRSNIAVPSALWQPGDGKGNPMPALDFFERAEVINFYVQPTHPANPSFGNVDGNSIFPIGATGAERWPYIASQFDLHEGIQTPAPLAVGVGSPPPILYSPVGATGTGLVSRLPDGVFIIGFDGYRILQTPGPAY